MITCEEKCILNQLQGKTITNAILTEPDCLMRVRCMELHFDNGTFLEIYESGDGLRVAGIRDQPGERISARQDHQP
ncbi:MAG: hypothetical protein HQM03_12090 [Magnetococcales bacterium]|nr:hypothetical protein [Magnetococcales bacterium]